MLNIQCFALYTTVNWKKKLCEDVSFSSWKLYWPFFTILPMLPFPCWAPQTTRGNVIMWAPCMCGTGTSRAAIPQQNTSTLQGIYSVLWRWTNLNPEIHLLCSSRLRHCHVKFTLKYTRFGLDSVLYEMLCSIEKQQMTISVRVYTVKLGRDCSRSMPCRKGALKFRCNYLKHNYLEFGKGHV